jgi:hypothetical protein
VSPVDNRGMEYENKIRNILITRHLLPEDLVGNDVGFKHNGKDYFVEVKNASAPDFGQKRVRWTQEAGWYWAEEDIVTKLYDKYNILDEINPKFIPRRHSKLQDKITKKDKIYNQKRFERSGITFEDSSILYEYYARKNCHYIQIEDLGFYYLADNPARLGVPQFKPVLQLRFRAKTHHSHPIYAYSFFVVIQKRGEIEKSNFDLEIKVGAFPNITPRRA